MDNETCSKMWSPQQNYKIECPVNPEPRLAAKKSPTSVSFYQGINDAVVQRLSYYCSPAAFADVVLSSSHVGTLPVP
ncbi:hypothetical protein D5086_027751 [Populus alba]|uniref:Uncharacterized protein n=1 Tax=Populus alba TaxID=43335 RepID=A0ACC4AX58_POPAL